MGSLDSINEKLKIAAENLDSAAHEISGLPLEPTKNHIRGIGEALTNIFLIQQIIYHHRPDLQPDYLNEERPEPEPDPDLTKSQKRQVEKLTDNELKEIDDQLLRHTCEKWRKVARVVGSTMIQNSDKNLPDVFYAQRIKLLVENGDLESQGNLNCMRFSEVRLLDNITK